jgi:hypothetical protein
MENNLIVFRNDHNKNYKTINLSCVQDKELSWKAKGIHNYFITRPNKWKINIEDLTKRSTDGTTKLYSGINELITSGYLFRIVKRGEGKQIQQWGFFTTETKATSEYVNKCLELEGSEWSIYNRSSNDKKRVPDYLEIDNLEIGFHTPINNKKENSNKKKENNENFSSKEEKNRETSFSSPSPRNSPINTLPISHKLNRRILTKAGKLRSLSIIKRHQEVPVKEIRVSPVIRDLLEHWLELKLYLPKENTKTFMEGVTKLKKLLSGTLFGQQFNVEQIKVSMDRFALAALDPDFEPSKPAYKKILAKMSPSAFIENLYSVGEKSFFLKYTKEEPQASRDIEHLLADKYPTMTKNLINLYREKVLSNSKIKFNAKEENCFIRTSQMIHKFFKDNSSQINHYSMPSDSEKVQYLWEALLADVGEGSANIRKITPGWFCSDATFHHRYPAYLTQQGVLYFEEDTDSLSSLSSRQEDIDPFGLYD